MQLAAGEGPDIARVTDLGGLVEVLPRHHAVHRRTRSTGRRTSARRSQWMRAGAHRQGHLRDDDAAHRHRALRQQDAVRAGEGSDARPQGDVGRLGGGDAQGREGDARCRSRWRWTAAAIASPAPPSAWARRSSTPRATLDRRRRLQGGGQEVLDWNKDGTMPKEVWGGVGGSTYRDAFEEFANGRVVMYLSGSWQVKRMDTQVGEEVRLDRRAGSLRSRRLHGDARRRGVRRAEAHQGAEGRREVPRLPRERAPSTRSTWRAPRTFRRTQAVAKKGVDYDDLAGVEGRAQRVRRRRAEDRAGRSTRSRAIA